LSHGTSRSLRIKGAFYTHIESFDQEMVMKLPIGVQAQKQTAE
jgi:hypothetical protein